MDGLNEYLSYHKQSSIAGDIDPQNDCLLYVANRFELNTEQRYWLAFLFGTCYCAPTVYYIYNEFPDYSTVDVNRLKKWWDQNKSKLVFQTDRQRVRSNDQFVDSFISYRNIVGKTQENLFSAFKTKDPTRTYSNALKVMSDVFSFGRFTMFIYLEMVSVLTDCKMKPDDLDLKNAESCRNGLALALDRKDLFTHFNDKKLTPKDYFDLESGLTHISNEVEKMNINHKSMFAIETTLCAYKKAKLGKRYIGYYIDRNKEEIEKMSKNIPNGVDWSVLWDFRKTAYNAKYLKELK
jgi:Alpha-glutamyl/putrescinyl thymine pyrophosphorylase clade 2